MSKWLDDMHKNSQKLTTIAYALESYANSFSHIGNDTMADELYRFHNLLLQIAESNHQIAGDIVNRELKESQAMSGTILKAALAGAFTAKEDKNANDS